MAKIEFSVEQEKALIRYFSKKYPDKRCYNCKHVNGCYYPNLSKTCSSCKEHSKWKPDKYCLPFIYEQIEIIKKNK